MLEKVLKREKNSEEQFPKAKKASWSSEVKRS